MMRENSFISGAKLVLSPTNVVAFVFGSLALSIAGNAVFSLLTNAFGAAQYTLFIITVCALGVLFFVGWILNKFLGRLRYVPTLAHDTPAMRKGLILLVSNETVCRKDIEFHRETLQYCWLVHSTDARSSDTARKLCDELVKADIRAEQVQVNDVYNLSECKRKIEDIYRKLPDDLTENDVILDFTGMTAVVSLGAVLACLDEKRPIQYTPATYNELKAPIPLNPIEVVLNWETLSLPDKSKSK